ncbi:MAG TPA: YceI family protein [Micropepsaceae bacterium]|nr:YceI family protein [Micropepsaceae bacterium]
MNRTLCRFAAGVALALGLSAPSLAANWTVDAAQSSLGFEASMNNTGFQGRFEDWRAEISFDPADLSAAKASVTINMSSARTGDATRDAALPNGDWFDVSGFAEATFETTAFRAMGGDAYEADGILTLRGVAKPVTLPFTLTIADGVAVMDGAVTLNRGDFGVGQGEFTGDTPVALAVKVVVHIKATAQ